MRQRLEQAADDEGRDGTERQRCRQGAADLDQAAIRTLHSFAAQLLHERPLEAGLPPGFETTDEIAAGIKFNEAWESWLNEALEGKTAFAPDLATALTLGMTPDDMRGVGPGIPPELRRPARREFRRPSLFGAEWGLQRGFRNVRLAIVA